MAGKKKSENIREEVKEVVPKVKLELWTLDIREKGGVSDKYVETLSKELAAEGKKLSQLYCTDAQREVLKGSDVCKDVTLTVE